MKKFVITAALAAVVAIASPVQAATLAETLAALGFSQSQIAAVVAVSGETTSTATSATPFNWNGSLIKYGSKGQQVKDLQNCMNRLGFSTGYADGIYGPNTFAGIAAFQRSKGLVDDGIVGKMTAPHFENACNAGEEVVVVVEEEENTDFGSSKGEEADVKVSDVDSDEDLDNDKKEQKAFTFEIEADEKGGDAQVERADLKFVITPNAANTSAEEDLYDIIEKVTIEVDGKEVASVDSDDDDDWRNLTSSDKEGVIRISGLDTVVKSDEKVEFDVLLDIADLDDDTTPASSDLNLDIALTNVEVRYTDEAGITDTVSKTSTEKVTVEKADLIDFDVDENKDNEDDKTITLEKESKKDVSLVIADVEIDDADGTLEKVEAVINITTNAANGATAIDTDKVLKEVTLYVDGNKVDDDDAKVTVAASAAAGTFPVTFTFDADDMSVKDGKTYEFELKGDFDKLDAGSVFIGSKVKVASLKFEGEDENDNDFSPTETTSFANNVTASAGALVLEEGKVVVSEIGSDDKAAKFVFDVEVEADGDNDIRIDSLVFKVNGTSIAPIVLNANDAAIETALDAGAAGDWTFEVKDADGDAVATATDIVNDGSKESYEIKITFDPASTGSYELELEKINWTENGTASNGTPFTAGATGALDMNLESDDIDLLA